MSKPVRVKHASILDPGPILAWALAASMALHALVLLAPALGLPRPVAVPDPVVSALTARLEPAPPAPAPPDAVQSAPEVLKNTIDKPAAEPRPPPAPKPRPPPAPRAAAKQPAPPAERLSGPALGETLGRLNETLLYPPEALKRGLEGEVVLMLELDERGRIVAASVASGSGHALLDEAALRAARRLGALGPSVAGKAILLPVRFRIL